MELRSILCGMLIMLLLQYLLSSRYDVWSKMMTNSAKKTEKASPLDRSREYRDELFPRANRTFPFPYPSFFGYVHVAKTAGSSFNRMLARTYYGICGNKGYTFDQPLEDIVIKVPDPDHPKHSNVRVHPSTLRERGFHNCALLGLEESWKKWQDQPFNTFYHNMSKVALIPCRDPIDHFLSRCNYVYISVKELFQNDGCEARTKCTLLGERFNPNMFDFFDHAVLFHYKAFSSVTEMLDQYLPRRFKVLRSDLIFEQNRPRNHTAEVFDGQCNAEDLRKLLLQESYYQYCAGVDESSPLKVLF